MSTEQIEFELSELKGKEVIVIIPQFGASSFSYIGNLNVVETSDHSLGFHITNGISGIAFIFYACDVQVLQPGTSPRVARVIRLGKRLDQPAIV